MDFRSAAEFIRQSLVCIYLNDRKTDDQAWHVASGVLVTLGGYPFVLTAGHNLLGYSIPNIFLMFPRFGLVVPWQGGRAIKALHCSRDPDVGVIELEPDDRVYWQHMTPLTEPAFATAEEVDAKDVVLLGGYPASATSPSRMDEREDPRRPHMFSSAGLTARMRIVEGIRSEYEPSDGRGIHVAFHGDGFFDVDANRYVDLPPPEGLSGGPLLAVSETRSKLLGLARSKHGGEALYEWFEPAFEALRLLIGHSDPRVRDAVAAVLSRVTPTRPG